MIHKGMDATQPPFVGSGGSVKTEAALFDFVESQPSCGGIKSLGVYVEPNNNSEVKGESGPFDGQMFWNDKEGGLLDEITPWGDWSESKGSVENTDGTVYTLTVLNSTESWSKTVEKTKKAETLDLESFLNILPETESDSSNYFYPEYSNYVEPKDLPPSPSTNNNDWKINNNNTNTTGSMNESLLRNALQGKAFQRHYASSCKKQVRGCGTQFSDINLNGQYPIENGTSSHIDEILGFSGVDAYGEDYEKIKKIANEVADCAKYSLPLCGNDLYPLPSTDTLLHPSLQPNSMPPGKCLNKRFAKKTIPSPGGSSKTNSASARKERSLHYCTICAKGFKDKYSVNVHVRTHTGEKPFSCNLCGKSFRQKAHLAKHYQTHLAQSQKQMANGGPSPGRPRPKVATVDGQHR